MDVCSWLVVVIVYGIFVGVASDVSNVLQIFPEFAEMQAELKARNGSSCNFDSTKQSGPAIKQYSSMKWQCFADCMTDPVCAAATHNGQTCWLHHEDIPSNRDETEEYSLFIKDCMSVTLAEMKAELAARNATGHIDQHNSGYGGIWNSAMFSSPGSSCNLDNTGQKGHDIKSYKSMKWQCFADCMTDPGCAAATHNGETCSLHDKNVPGNRYDSGDHSLFLKNCEVAGPRVEQWVQLVLRYSSQYNSDTWSASQVIGEPNVFPKYGDIRGTWAQRDRDSTEYLELKFQEKVYIKAVEIYETYHSGGVTKISAKTPAGGWFELWKAHAAVDMKFSRIFSPAITIPDFLSNVIRLDVDCTVAGTYVEIDAVKLIGILPAKN